MLSLRCTGRPQPSGLVEERRGGGLVDRDPHGEVHDLDAEVAEAVDLTGHPIGVDINSSSGNPHGIKRTSHSVLTEHLVDEPGHPTRDGLDRVIAFFRERLAP